MKFFKGSIINTMNSLDHTISALREQSIVSTIYRIIKILGKKTGHPLILKQHFKLTYHETHHTSATKKRSGR